MTYFGFLLRFVFLPILVLGLLTWQDERQGRHLHGFQKRLAGRASTV